MKRDGWLVWGFWGLGVFGFNWSLGFNWQVEVLEVRGHFGLHAVVLGYTLNLSP